MWLCFVPVHMALVTSLLAFIHTEPPPFPDTNTPLDVEALAAALRGAGMGADDDDATHSDAPQLAGLKSTLTGMSCLIVISCVRAVLLQHFHVDLAVRQFHRSGH